MSTSPRGPNTFATTITGGGILDAFLSLKRGFGHSFRLRDFVFMSPRAEAGSFTWGPDTISKTTAGNGPGPCLMSKL